MNSEIIKTLKNLGFTEYEAKAYLALLEKSPLTGYGVALNSGVPRSKIYEVLDGLVQSGEVITSYGAPVLYAPLPPKELIEHRRKKTESDFDAAKASLEHFTTNIEVKDNIWNIAGRDEIMNKANDIIKNATEEVLITIWEEDAIHMIPVLNETIKRGVNVQVVVYGDIKLDSAKVIKYPIENMGVEDKETRCMAVCADKKEAIEGIISLENESLAASSMHPGLVIPVYEHIKRSMMMADIFMIDG